MHNLQEVGGVVPMFYAAHVERDVWHRDTLKTLKTLAGLSVDEVFALMDDQGRPQFGFPIGAEALTYTWDGATRQSGMYALLRTDYGNQLGVVTKSYTVFDQDDGRRLAKKVFRDNPITTGGVLGGGEKTWLMADSGGWLVGNDEREEMKGHLALAWGHDGAFGVRLLESHTRIVCQNTLELACGNGKYYFSFRHTANLVENITEIERQLDRIADARTGLKAKCDTLYGTPIPEDYVKSFAGRLALKVIPEPKHKPGVIRAIADKADIMGAVINATMAEADGKDAREKREARRNDIIMHVIENTIQETDLANGDLTGWRLVNGATGWMDHQSRSRGESRITSELGGDRSELKGWIIDTILAETKAA